MSDNIQEKYLELQEKYKTLENEKNNYVTKISEFEKEINDLKQLNQKLFLKATQIVENKQQTKEKTITIEDLKNKIKGVKNNGK